MTPTLVLHDELSDGLAEAAGQATETGGVLLASLLRGPTGDIRLLGDAIRWVDEAAYIKRTRNEMLIASQGYVPALGEAADRGLLPIWLHTHPGRRGVPLPSQYDLEVDRQLADVFRLRAGTSAYATLIVSPRPDGLAFSGAMHWEGGSKTPIERLWQVGNRWRLTRSVDSPSGPVPEVYDRNVRAFGDPIQGMIGGLRVGVVGVGGTGSAVCEQLARLGVRQLLLVDADAVSASNVTRVYGSTPQDVGRPKVDVMKDHLQRIAPDLACETVRSMVTLESAARQLTDCDVIFGCTDDNAGRLVLSRIATFLLTPVIDVGVLLSSGRDGRLIGIDGRVTVLTPGAACLVCRDRIDLDRAAAELMTPDERKRRADEGYAPALVGREPAVIAFTTSVAAAAVGELLERLIGYGPEPRPTELLLRWHEREISTNASAPRSGHYCDRCSGKWGQGARTPFLGQIWPEE